MDAQTLQNEAQSAIAASTTLDELDAERVRYLGRKSPLKRPLRGDRGRDSGIALNAGREALEEAVTTRRAELERAELDRVLSQEAVDVTLPSLPGEELRLGTLHPTTQTRRLVE